MVIKTHKELIDKTSDNIIKHGNILNKYVRKTLLEINRKFYTDNPLTNSPTKIYEQFGLSQTISAPFIHHFALNTLLSDIDFNNKISALDIGCGSGYITACLCSLLKIDKNPENIVVGIDIFNNLVYKTLENMMKNEMKYVSKIYGGSNKNNNLYLFHSDGWLGYNLNNFSNFKKYNKFYTFIHVGAEADKIPIELLKQLDLYGKMIIPVNNRYLLIKRINWGNNLTNFKIDKVLDVRFVKLLKKNNLSFKINNKKHNVNKYYSKNGGFKINKKYKTRKNKSNKIVNIDTKPY